MPIYIYSLGFFLGQSHILNANTANKASVSHSETLLPEPITSRKRSCYSMGYDTRNKNPSWVYELLTAECLTGNAKRIHCKFQEDDTIPNIFRATLQDYKGSGFDRGHLAPAANHKRSLLEMNETFLLSNMAPQDPNFNRGYWSKLEKYVRNLTNEWNAIHVYTGPLYLPTLESDGSKWIKYRVIGENNVSVPTLFFKIVILENAYDEVTTEGYVLPNEPIHSQKPINDFITTVEWTEKASGIIFQAYKD
ncbi:MAG: DNA/RNA non-specific endonuclease [Parachlamydiaceae bacterium]|nr:DNA/RNA non-specific endonuclease [Parachlamydiaceae bacterium]